MKNQQKRICFSKLKNGPYANDRIKLVNEAIKAFLV